MEFKTHNAKNFRLNIKPKVKTFCELSTHPEYIEFQDKWIKKCKIIEMMFNESKVNNKEPLYASTGINYLDFNTLKLSRRIYQENANYKRQVVYTIFFDEFIILQGNFKEIKIADIDLDIVKQTQVN